MGTRGPVPKRSSQRRRQNKEGQVEAVTVDSGVVEQPDIRGDIGDLAGDWYRALAASGQAKFYEPSDWETAKIVAEAIDSFDRKPAAMMLSSISSMMGSLLVTEGDRRRVRLELERVSVSAEDGDGEVARLDEFRRRASS